MTKQKNFITVQIAKNLWVYYTTVSNIIIENMKTDNSRPAPLFLYWRVEQGRAQALWLLICWG